jgi:monoamine oxidase
VGNRIDRIRVVVAGAGFAGLAAARELEERGAEVTVVEARDRVGGRVHTLRDDLAPGTHAEAGADLIEGEQSHVLDLAKALGLKTVRILRNGFGYYGPDKNGKRRIRSGPGAFGEAAKHLHQEISDYCLAGERWDSAVAIALARTSVASWMTRIGADVSLQAGLRGFRGFFLADPEDLSIIALVDQFAGGGTPGQDRIYRVEGGNDRIATEIARRLRGKLLKNTVVRAVRQTDDGVRVTIEKLGLVRELSADYCVIALPATTLRDVIFEPALPDDQRRAIETLKYGCATRLLLQFERPYWRKAGRPRAYGTDLPTGALWEGAEEQKAAVLSFLAGGKASRELQEIIAREGTGGVLARIAWLGPPAPVLHAKTITWEDDPWSRGGYAYFDPAFDPRLRAWLARPAGRVLFAGEHTSHKWQGYMNGAIETGKRAAAEVRALSSR